MDAKVRWVDDAMFVGESGSGHAVVMDGPPDFGGKNLGIRPMEMLLLGLGGCSNFDVVLILKKLRQKIIHCDVEIKADRAEQDPKVFTAIHLHFVVEGDDLDEKKVERAINLSAEKYCSASIMLGQVAKITHDFEII
jgi:putative redox protein